MGYCPEDKDIPENIRATVKEGAERRRAKEAQEPDYCPDVYDVRTLWIENLGRAPYGYSIGPDTNDEYRLIGRLGDEYHSEQFSEALDFLFRLPWVEASTCDFDENLVLCNLSKKLYVCEAAIDDLKSRREKRTGRR